VAKKRPSVWVHTFDPNDPDALGESEGPREFLRVPSIAEEFQLEQGGDTSKVVRVVHLPYPDADSDVEIYGEKVLAEVPVLGG
jgi:hypothetical protein